MVEHKIGELVRRGPTTYMCKMYRGVTFSTRKENVA